MTDPNYPDTSDAENPKEAAAPNEETDKESMSESFLIPASALGNPEPDSTCKIKVMSVKDGEAMCEWVKEDKGYDSKGDMSGKAGAMNRMSSMAGGDMGEA